MNARHPGDCVTMNLCDSILVNFHLVLKNISISWSDRANDNQEGMEVACRCIVYS